MSDALVRRDAPGDFTCEAAAVYGEPPAELARVPDGAVQVSPTRPGSRSLEDCPEVSLTGFVMLAPPGTLERRYALALALRATRPGATLTLLAPKARGGSRLRGELEGFGCTVVESARRHHRVCEVVRPAMLEGIAEAVAAGAPRQVEALGLWSQPGIFSWDRIDPGSALLAARLPALAGIGADLGCGIGGLGLDVLRSPGVTRLALVDSDRRAIECARRNVADPRASAIWADLRAARAGDDMLSGLDFVVMNPPFHEHGAEDRGLGQACIRAAAAALRKGGICWLVANRHLPYEKTLGELFADVATIDEQGGYKVARARR